MTYLEDGRCSLSNNLSENSIRPVTIGRKNWLFSDTPDGASANALYLTIVEMAKAYNLNLYEYHLFDAHFIFFVYIRFIDQSYCNR